MPKEDVVPKMKPMVLALHYPKIAAIFPHSQTLSPSSLPPGAVKNPTGERGISLVNILWHHAHVNRNVTARHTTVGSTGKDALPSRLVPD